MQTAQARTAQRRDGFPPPQEYRAEECRVGVVAVVIIAVPPSRSLRKGKMRTDASAAVRSRERLAKRTSPRSFLDMMGCEIVKIARDGATEEVRWAPSRQLFNHIRHGCAARLRPVVSVQPDGRHCGCKRPPNGKRIQGPLYSVQPITICIDPDDR